MIAVLEFFIRSGWSKFYESSVHHVDILGMNPTKEVRIGGFLGDWVSGTC